MAALCVGSSQFPLPGIIQWHLQAAAHLAEAEFDQLRGTFSFAVVLHGTEQAPATFSDPCCASTEPRTTATFTYSPRIKVLMALDLSV